jgi:hypothetical protein
VAGEPERRGPRPLQDVIEHLGGAGFRLLPAFAIGAHYAVERGGFIALVEKHSDGAFGAAGLSGILMDGNFAVPVWRSGVPLFISKGRESPATPEQIGELRHFAHDLREALS